VLKKNVAAPAINRTTAPLPAATLLTELPVLYCWRCNGQINADKEKGFDSFLRRKYCTQKIVCAYIFFCVGLFNKLQAACGIRRMSKAQ
jgi:hypothetical protein